MSQGITPFNCSPSGLALKPKKRGKALTTQPIHFPTTSPVTDDRSKSVPSSSQNHRPFRARRKGHGPSTGLRAVTMAVVNRLKQGTISSYNDMAMDITNDLDPNATQPEARNIRRRAYDVINVMEAVGMVHKRKKRLFTIESLAGLEVEALVREKKERLDRIQAKQEALNKILNQDLKEVQVVNEDDYESALQFVEDQGFLEGIKQEVDDFDYEDERIIRQVLENLSFPSKKSVIVKRVNEDAVLTSVNMFGQETREESCSLVIQPDMRSPASRFQQNCDDEDFIDGIEEGLVQETCICKTLASV